MYIMLPSGCTLRRTLCLVPLRGEQEYAFQDAVPLLYLIRSFLRVLMIALLLYHFVFWKANLVSFAHRNTSPFCIILF